MARLKASSHRGNYYSRRRSLTTDRIIAIRKVWEALPEDGRPPWPMFRDDRLAQAKRNDAQKLTNDLNKIRSK